MKKTVSTIDSIVDLIKKIGKNKVKFIILYGSFATGKQHHLSDIDIAVYYDANKTDRFNFRMRVLGEIDDKYDIQIFQDLPLYLKEEVIKGRILFSPDSRFLYDLVRNTHRDFEDFKIKFFDYIEGGVIS